MDRIHPNSTTIIERLDANCKTHTSGGGRVRAEARREARATPGLNANTASTRGRSIRSRRPTAEPVEPNRVAAERLPGSKSPWPRRHCLGHW